MKKYFSVLLAVAALVSLAACGAKKEQQQPKETTAAVTAAALLTLPNGSESKLFNNVPKPNAVQSRYTQGKDENGYVYTFEFDGMGYESFKFYVNKLKEAGFAYHSTSVNALAAKEPTFAAKAVDCGDIASWLGVRSGLYVNLNWYGDEFYAKNKITGPSCRITFWTYNPFTTTETTKKSK